MKAVGLSGVYLSPQTVDVLDWVPAILWVSDLEGQCQYVNAAYREYTGASVEDSLGQGWLAALHPEDAAAWPREVHEALVSRRGFSADCRLRRRDGRYRWMMKKVQPTYDSEGNANGFVGCCWDITSQRQATESLRQASDRHRSIVGHLRQALAAVEEFVHAEGNRGQAAGDDRLTPRQREILQLIARGYATREIAAQLHVSVKTVESHRAQLMQRLNIHDVAGLTRYAIRTGLVRPDV
jgi:PAS domain S-box-containing protein